METIRPSVTKESMLCAETPAPRCGLVIFGASGDLTKRKIIPALAGLFKRQLLARDFFCLGCGRKKLSDSDFRKIAEEAIDEGSQKLDAGPKKDFLSRLHYISGDYTDQSLYISIREKLAQINKDKQGGVIFYLALPPSAYQNVVNNIGDASLNKEQEGGFARLVVEKPFGRDLASATELNDCLSKWFSESQIYRIDHYLGKETVQNILLFRFANSIFEPIWNRNYIDHVQITIAESIGVQARGSSYDKSGALRDMFQNHMLSMVSLVAMEPPASFQAEHIRDEKVKLLGSIRPFNLEPWGEDILRGQYDKGSVDGKTVPAYRQEENIKNDSNTETYIGARLFIDNWRWKGVPFYLRTGKRLAKKVTEIAIIFKKTPHAMFASSGIDELAENVLVLKIQPYEGISLLFEAKKPGAKLCMGTLAMDFDYEQVFGSEPHDAYERLLLDCMAGDQTLFTRIDDVKIAWTLVDKVLNMWQSQNSEPYLYPAGAESFPQADTLIQKDGREWRNISKI